MYDYEPVSLLGTIILTTMKFTNFFLTLPLASCRPVEDASSAVSDAIEPAANAIAPAPAANPNIGLQGLNSIEVEGGSDGVPTSGAQKRDNQPDSPYGNCCIM